jgi:DNA repair protein RadC
MTTREGTSYHLMIREMDPEERPRERLQHAGAMALSNTELIAILLNTGMKGESAITISQRLLRDHGGLPGLHRMDFHELATVRGIGPSKACKVQAAFELGRRLAAVSSEDRVRIESPEDVVNLLGVEMAGLAQEQLRVVIMDTKHRVITTKMVYQGTANAATVRAAEVFRDAVKLNATNIALVHNHPSGDPTPSSADIAVTTNIVEAGKHLDIGVLDHIIIGQGRHVSLKRMGLGFPRA